MRRRFRPFLPINAPTKLFSRVAKAAGAAALWKYRDFILGSVKREFQAKYNSSLLGSAWTIISPLSMIAVYTIVFSSVMHAKIPGMSDTRNGSYGVYLCAGIFSWGLFSEIVSRSLGMLIDNSSLLKKLSFPRICLPAIAVLSSLVNFSLVFSIFALFLVAIDSFPGLSFVAVIPLTFVLVAFAIGLGVTLGILNVFFRDVGHVTAVILQFWFWLTPIVYVRNILPAKVEYFMQFNPMAAIIESYQQIAVTGQWPAWKTLLYPAALSLILCYLGIALFRKNIGDIVDEL